MTTIRYFIPEDGDEEIHPNVFLAPKSRQQGAAPTLKAVRDAFPLPGHYHFRFKSPLYPGGDREKGAMAVWMDVTQDQQPVPTWQNGIVAKVTRISMEEEEDDDDDDFVRPSAAPVQQAAPPPRPPVSHASSVGSADHLDIFGGPSPQANSSSFDSQPPPAAPTSGGSLLDFGAGPPAPPPTTIHTDFFGMTAPAMSQAPTPPPQQHYQQQQQQQQSLPPPQSRGPPQQSMNAYSKQAQPFGDLGGWT